MHLKELRARRNQTQWGLRNQTGISQTKLSLFEQGYLDLSAKEKVKIAKALEVNIGDIDWDSGKKVKESQRYKNRRRKDGLSAKPAAGEKEKH